jgi:hemoglobin/transferrin/lactoferrin receptor protein
MCRLSMRLCLIFNKIRVKFLLMNKLYKISLILLCNPLCLCFGLRAESQPSSMLKAVDSEEDSGVEITVVATRRAQPTLETAGTSSAVGATTIIQSGSVTLSDALKYEPGVSVPFDFSGESGLVPYLGGGDQGVNIRGLEGNRVAILIDGIRQPEDFVAQSFLGAGGPGRIYFDPAVLDRIELFKSASSSLYGSDALGGTVSAQTVSPGSLLGSDLNGRALESTLTYASVNESINNRLTGAWGDGTVATSLVYSYREGEETKNNSNLDPNPQDFYSYATVWKLGYYQDTWSLGTIFDYFSYDNFTDAQAGEGAFFGGLIQNDVVTQDDKRERLRVSLDASFSPDGGTPIFDSFDASIYYQDASFETLNVQQGTVFSAHRDRTNEITYETETFGINLQAEKSFFGAFVSQTITYGLELSKAEVSNSFIRTDFPLGGGATISDRVGMAPSDVTRGGFFIQDEITLGSEGRWLVTPGLRVDSYQVDPDNTDAFLNRTIIPGTTTSVSAVDYENVAFAPSLSVLYSLTDDVNIYGLYSRGIRNPSAEELNGVFTHGTDFVVVPNADLVEEQSDSFEVGLQVSTEHHAFQFASYYNFYSNFLESNVLIVDNADPDPDVLTTVNRGDSEIYGIEVSWDWKVQESVIGAEGFEVGAAFAWTEGEDTDSGEPLNSVDPLKLTTYLGYRATNGKWGTRLTATYIAEKDGDDISGDPDPTDSVTLLDLTANYAINENWGLSAGINNLTNKSYFLWSTARRGAGHGGEAGSRNTQPGRNFFISVNAKF